MFKAIRPLVLAVLAGAALTGPMGAQTPDPYATQCAMATWSNFLRPGAQTPEYVESIQLDGAKIVVFRFDELAGQYGKLFVFLRDNGRCFEKVFSVGSYELTASRRTEGPRLYHADLYEEGLHATIGFFDGPPAYEAMRQKALELLK